MEARIPSAIGARFDKRPGAINPLAPGAAHAPGAVSAPGDMAVCAGKAHGGGAPAPTLIEGHIDSLDTHNRLLTATLDSLVAFHSRLRGSEGPCDVPEAAKPADLGMLASVDRLLAEQSRLLQDIGDQVGRLNELA